MLGFREAIRQASSYTGAAVFCVSFQHAIVTLQRIVTQAPERAIRNGRFREGIDHLDGPDGASAGKT
jgi:hypothetical protein